MTTMEYTDQGEALDMRFIFENGVTIEAPTRVLHDVKGVDAMGLLVVGDSDVPGLLYSLTDCCFASAKGSMGAIVCRGCYEEIDPLLGGPAEIVCSTFAFEKVA